MTWYKSRMLSQKEHLKLTLLPPPPQTPNSFEPILTNYFHLSFYGHLNYSFPLSVLLNMNEAGEVWPQSRAVCGAGFYL